MYWNHQEKAAFWITLSVVFIFHISSGAAIWQTRSLAGLEGILLLANIGCIAGMGFYARWVWKPVSLLQAFRNVLFYEGILLSLMLTLLVIRVYLTLK